MMNKSWTVRQYAMALMCVCVFLWGPLGGTKAFAQEAYGEPADEAGETDTSAPPPGVVNLGLVTGGFYDAETQSLSAYAEQSFSEFQLLGVKWIRVEVNFHGTPDWVYRRLVELAHRRGIKVIIVLNREYFDEGNTDEWIVGYIGDPDNFNGSPPQGSLHHYAYKVFGRSGATSPEARPDAYEILNEPNIYCAQVNPDLGCTESRLGHYRVNGNTFAWLLRYVWDWKLKYNRPEKIISGGPLNIYWYVGKNQNDLDAWWRAFFEAGSWGLRPSRPFDYMGIHPYQPYDYDQVNCINQNQSGCFAPWKTRTAQLLHSLKERMNGLPNVGSSWKFFVTEFGWQLSPAGEGQPCPVDAQGMPTQVNCVKHTWQQAEAMGVANDTFRESFFNNVATVDTALWFSWRDGGGEFFGLRYYCDWCANRFPARGQSWQKFQQLAGRPVSDPNESWRVPDSCPGPPGRQCFLRFNDDTLSSFDYYIEDLSQQGVLDGEVFDVPPGDPKAGVLWRYYAGTPATREALVRWIVRARLRARHPAWPGFDITGGPHFQDVPEDHVGYHYVETAFWHGMIGGYPCGGPNEPCVPPRNLPYLRPNNNVTRGQMSKMIFTAMGWNDQPTTQRFQDVPPGSTFYRFVEALAARGIVGGYPCGGPYEPCVPPENRPYFRPNNDVTRGQASKFISNSNAQPNLNAEP